MCARLISHFAGEERAFARKALVYVAFATCIMQIFILAFFVWFLKNCMCVSCSNLKSHSTFELKISYSGVFDFVLFYIFEKDGGMVGFAIYTH